EARSAPLDQRVLVLGLDVTAADLNCVELIAADAPVKDLETAGARVERPASRTFYEWHRKRPVVFADVQKGASRVLWLQRYVVLDAGFSGELLRDFAIARGFAGVKDVVAVWSKNGQQRLLIIFFGCVDQCTRCLFRGWKRFRLGRNGRLRGC